MKTQLGVKVGNDKLDVTIELSDAQMQEGVILQLSRVLKSGKKSALRGYDRVKFVSRCSGGKIAHVEVV